MDLFSLDPGLTIWTWISFGILVLILTKWVIPRVFQNLKDRQDVIARSIDNAAEIEARLAAIDHERQEILRQTRGEAEALLKKAREESEVLKRSLREEAEREAAGIVAQGKAKFAEDRQASIEALRAELADFVLVCAGTIVGSTLSGARERKWSRDLVKTL
jgi:F-type H+-transporting ATPase subunit b